jgi:hypothetical protein
MDINSKNYAAGPRTPAGNIPEGASQQLVAGTACGPGDTECKYKLGDASNVVPIRRGYNIGGIHLQQRLDNMASCIAGYWRAFRRW